MRSVSLVVGVALVCAGSVAAAKKPPCTEQQAIAAEQEASVLRDWEQIYASFTRYGQCDDGAIAEGYSDSVANVLSEHLETLATLAAVASR